MDRDFHFGATYAAAYAVFGDVYDAVIIARAAQYVDEFSGDPYNEVRKAWTSRNKGIAQTVQTTAAMVLHNASNYTGVDRWTAHIWPVFHFLPAITLPSDMLAVTVKDDDERALLSLLCAPYSPMANALIEETRRVWSKVKNTDSQNEKYEKYQAKRQDYLIRIGITMHVLADTFAHANFFGLPCKNINEVSKVREDGWPTLYSYAPAESAEGYGYMGHGRIGHLPDEAWRHYTYQPQWSSHLIERNNPVIYTDAFFYLKNVLAYIDGQRDTFPRSQTEISCTPDERREMEAFFRDGPKSVEGQEKAWITRNSSGTVTMRYKTPDFKSDKDFMMSFGRQAWKHQDLVFSNCELLRDIMASPRVTV